MLDLNGLKEQIQRIFNISNTTTSSVDLSRGLSQRVQRVLKVNPGRIPIQADWFPCVTIFIDQKDIELLDITPSQIISKRKADVSVKVVGAIWNSLVTNPELDPADNDCETLMENIEQILRANPELYNTAVVGASIVGDTIIGTNGVNIPQLSDAALIGSAVIGRSIIGPRTSWLYPTGVTYHNAILDEGVNLRAGMMSLEVTLFY